MGRPKRLYPLGRYRLRVPKDAEADKAYPVVLEYTWNRQIIRKTTNVFAKIADWNQNGNQGRGELRVSYGSEYKRLNQLLLARVERIDSLLAEYNERNPNGLTVCLRSIMRGIRIRLQPKLWRASLQTSRLHGETKGRILWNLLWSAFRPITPETGLAGAVMKMARVA